MSATAYSQGNHNHRVSGRFSAASPPPVTPPPTGEFVFNKLRLGAKWFEQGITEEVVRLLIHEFGHQYSPDHLSAEYHEALCRIGARLYALARHGEV